MKLTYNEIMMRAQVLANILKATEGAKLAASTMTSLLLLRIAYQKKGDEYNDTCSKALEEIKKEEKYKDFDEKARADAQMKDVFARLEKHEKWDGAEEERPAKPSEEEIKKAQEAKAVAGEFDSLSTALLDAYNDARAKAAAEQTDFEPRKLTREELEDIVGAVGTAGDVTLSIGGNDYTETRINFLTMVANYFA